MDDRSGTGTRLKTLHEQLEGYRSQAADLRTHLERQEGQVADVRRALAELGTVTPAEEAAATLSIEDRRRIVAGAQAMLAHWEALRPILATALDVARAGAEALRRQIAAVSGGQ